MDDAGGILDELFGWKCEGQVRFWPYTLPSDYFGAGDSFHVDPY